MSTWQPTLFWLLVGYSINSPTLMVSEPTISHTTSHKEQRRGEVISFWHSPPYDRSRVGPNFPCISCITWAFVNAVSSTMVPRLGAGPLSRVLLAVKNRINSPILMSPGPAFLTLQRWQGAKGEEQGGYCYLFHATVWKTMGLTLPFLHIHARLAHLKPHQQGQLYCAALGRYRTYSPERCNWWEARPAQSSLLWVVIGVMNINTRLQLQQDQEHKHGPWQQPKLRCQYGPCW